MVRWPAMLLPLLAVGCGVRSPAVPRTSMHPVRVMSVNQCTDQLVLMLLPPARIASVTWLARDPSGSVMAAAAQRVGVNHGDVEDVIAEAPDLIVADTFGKPVLRGMLKRLGHPVLEVEEPGDIGGVRRATREVAAAVGERARGEALIAAMDATLAELARHPGPPIPVAAWSRDGIAAGRGTIEDEVIAAAGARNLGHDGGRTTDVETLLARDPSLLVETTAGEPASPSERDAVLRHPLIERYWRGRVIGVRGADLACGTPMIAAAARRLRSELRRAAGLATPLLSMLEGRP